MQKKKSFHWSVYVVSAVVVIRLMMDIFFSITQASLYSSIEMPSSNDYALRVFLDSLCILGYLGFLIEKTLFNYIILVIFCTCKLFLNVRQGTDISYAYMVGGNFLTFLIELLPLSAILFIKKNEITGWKLLSRKVYDRDGSSSDKCHKVSKWIQIAALAILTVLSIIICSRDYPDFVDTFSQKVSVFCGCHNNGLAKLSLQKAIDSEDSGLTGKSQYYIDWCKKFNPDDLDILTDLADYCFLQEDYEAAILLYKKALKQDPNNKNVKTAIAKCLYSSGNDLTLPWVESLIDEDPENSIAAGILRDHYHKVGNSKLAFYWGIRAFCYKENRQDEHDITVFAEILSDKICSVDYYNNSNTLIMSKSVDEQPIFCISNDEYLDSSDKIKERGILTLYMHNSRDIGIVDDVYYFVFIPGYQQGEIWHADKLKRNLKQLVKDHPNVITSSMVIIR